MVDAERSRSITSLLRSAAVHTPHLYGNDVKTAYQLLALVLQRESQQQGFELTATHDMLFNEVCTTPHAESLAFKGEVRDSGKRLLIFQFNSKSNYTRTFCALTC